MTPKNIIRADFREIPSIEIRCLNCGAMVILNLPMDTPQVPQQFFCPGCSHMLWGSGQEPSYGAVLGIIIALSNWKRRDVGNFELSFSLSTNV
jgi:DNA-directed RNA polymerase subunit RPC12/RpoP